MIISTTAAIDGKSVLLYKGVIGAEVIFGAFFLKDLFAENADFWGGRSGSYEKVFKEAREKALLELRQQADVLNANAVLNVRFDYSTLGEKNGMLMVAATGTAVLLEMSPEEKTKMAEREKLHVEETKPIYMVLIGEKSRGPFSIAQIRELQKAGRIGLDDATNFEDGTLGPKVSALVEEG